MSDIYMYDNFDTQNLHEKHVRSDMPKAHTCDATKQLYVAGTLVPRFIQYVPT